MTLQQYLDKNGIAADVFARKIRVSFSSVYKYRTGARKPREGVETKIWAITNGAVGPRDWERKPNGKSVLARKRRQSSKRAVAR